MATFTPGRANISSPFTINSNGGDVATAEDVPLTTHASLFVTGGSGETSTLAAGTEGQIKVLVMKTDNGGNMVTAVSDGSGFNRITFADVGDSCVLQYIDSNWYCIANNGATLSTA